MTARWSRTSQLPILGVAAIYLLTFALTAARTRAAATDFSLKGIRPVDPANLGDFVRDRRAAIVLGKALFWDMQTGSDGIQACASCHFNSGADNRVKNTLAPGGPGGNGIFDPTASGGGGPNETLTSADFPFHQLADPNDNTSDVVFDTDDVVGSQGVHKRSFIALSGTAVDSCADVRDPVFHVAGINVRQVTGRNAPSTINAAFNVRNFWDGRAREDFNGVNPAGATDPGARIFRTDADGRPQAVAVLIPNSSAASQAVGPPPNEVEMSCAGRTFPLIGRKLLGLTPLGRQTVSPTDSVLGSLANTQGKGLKTSYSALIQQAFQPNLWNATRAVMIGDKTFSQMEANFSLFWGLSIQLYEATLVSDDTRLDRFAAGDSSALTAQQQEGLALFEGKGRCNACHKGPLFTEATTGDGGNAFANTAVRPIAEDTGDVVDGNGRFKTPTLRNVEFTGPYFHNGGQATLRQVVDFYNRGGDFPTAFITESAIRPIGLTDTEKNALVAFLLALSDDRVRLSRAPFDHPEICVPNGEEGNTAFVTAESGTIRSRTTLRCIAANGAAGVATPLKTFLGLSPFQP